MSASKLELTPRDFALHLSINDTVVLNLLHLGTLPCRIDEQGRVRIMLSALSPERVRELLLLNHSSQQAKHPEVPEVIAMLEPLLAEAVELAVSWLENGSE